MNIILLEDVSRGVMHPFLFSYRLLSLGVYASKCCNREYYLYCFL